MNQTTNRKGAETLNKFESARQKLAAAKKAGSIRCSAKRKKEYRDEYARLLDRQSYAKRVAKKKVDAQAH